MIAPDRTTPPALHPLPAVNVAPARHMSLAGGANLTVVPGGDQPVARLILLWEGGGYDFADNAAVSVLVDAMLEGTRTLSADVIADRIDFEGARLNSRTAEHYVGLSLLGLSDRLASLLPVLRSIVAEPALSQEAIDVIARRSATAESVQQAKVAVRAARELKKLMAGADHAAAQVASPEDYLSLTSEDVRSVFAATIGRGATGLHAYLGGSFPAQLETEVVCFIESLGRSTSPSAINIQPYMALPPQRVDLAAPEAVQSAVAMALPVIGRDHPDYIPLRMAVMALGGHFGSRLMSEIRENRGLTYGIGASLLGTFEGAMVQIQAQCSADKVNEVIEQSLAEVRGLWERPLTADELERLRLNTWSALAAQADSPMSTLDYYVTRLTVGTPGDYFERQMQAIASMSAKSVADTARRYLADSWTVVTCGPNPSV